MGWVKVVDRAECDVRGHTLPRWEQEGGGAGVGSTYACDRCGRVARLTNIGRRGQLSWQWEPTPPPVPPLPPATAPWGRG